MSRKPKIRITPPGPNAKALIERDRAILATSTKTSPIAVKRAAGIYVEDLDGNLLMDFTSGVGVLNTGHCHPRIVNAIRKQVGDLMHFAGTDFYYESQVFLAEELVTLTPGDFPKKVFFTNSGAESVEAALKVVQWTKGKVKTMAFIGAFHGRTMGALSLTASKPVQRAKFLYTMAGVGHVPYPNCYRCPYKLSYPECDVWCIKIIDELYFDTFIPSEDVAGFFLEPIQGEGGYIVPPKKAITTLRKICDKHNIILVDDEVQAGFGRTGKWFGIDHFGVVPDVTTIAKGMGSGMPIGACVLDARLDWGVPGAHSNTYGGNPVACISSLATIEVMKDEKLLLNSTRVGEYLGKRLNELSENYPGLDNSRGLGLMRAIEFVKDKVSKVPDPRSRDKVLEKAYKFGLVLLPCGTSSIRFIPPLIINKEQMEAAMDVFEECVGNVLNTNKAVKVADPKREEEYTIVLPSFKGVSKSIAPNKVKPTQKKKARPKAKPKKKARSKAQPKKKARPKAKPKKKARSKAQPKKKARPKAQPKKKARSKAQPKKKARPKAQPKKKARPKAQPKKKARSKASKRKK